MQKYWWGVDRIISCVHISHVFFFAMSLSVIVLGIWGVSIGNREYALLCSTWGFEIIDVTDPSSPFKVQAVEMTGGLYWRDVATHTTASGKVYAYVAAQDVFDSGADLYVFDLSNLSGDQNNPNGKGSNPIPTSGYVNLGNSGEQ